MFVLLYILASFFNIFFSFYLLIYIFYILFFSLYLYFFSNLDCIFVVSNGCYNLATQQHPVGAVCLSCPPSPYPFVLFCSTFILLVDCIFGEERRKIRRKKKKKRGQQRLKRGKQRRK